MKVFDWNLSKANMLQELLTLFLCDWIEEFKATIRFRILARKLYLFEKEFRRTRPSSENIKGAYDCFLTTYFQYQGELQKIQDELIVLKANRLCVCLPPYLDKRYWSWNETDLKFALTSSGFEVSQELVHKAQPCRRYSLTSLISLALSSVAIIAVIV